MKTQYPVLDGVRLKSGEVVSQLMNGGSMGGYTETDQVFSIHSFNQIMDPDDIEALVFYVTDPSQKLIVELK